MLSAVNSFLPSVLQFNQDGNLLRPKNSEPNQNGDLQSSQSPAHTEEPTSNLLESKVADTQEAVDEVGARKKRTPPVNETFIIVRPPPAKSNHPLNLQLQLVPPTAPRITSTNQSIVSRQSMESINNPLERISSTTSVPSAPPATAGPNRSVTDISLYSTYSTASLASNMSSSSVSSTASARRIVPLYNLSAHNVMQNTVLDAGTDTKVAKFSKKGLEIIDLAFFELFEVWDSTVSLNMPLESSHPKGGSVIKSPNPKQEKSPAPSVTGQSRTSISNHSSSSLREDETPHAAIPSTTPNAEKGVNDAPKRGARKVFGKLFRKKDSISSSAPLLEVPSSPNALNSTFKRVSLERSPMPVSPLPSGFSESQRPIWNLLPPVLDLQATLIKKDEHRHRPASYVWVTRRWLKKTRGEGLKAMLSAAGDKMSNFNFPGLNVPSDERFMEMEVRFDWARADKKKLKRGRRASMRVKRSSMHGGEGGNIGRVSSMAELQPRSSSQTRSSPETESLVSREQHGPDSEHEDESDPEDSDTPWTCTMSLRRLQPLPRASSGFLSPSPSGSNIRLGTSTGRLEANTQSERPLSMSSNLSAEPRDDGAPIRVKIASLHPAPHHPKVVAQLKVPYPLPDIDISQGVVYRRKGKRTEHEAVRKEQDYMLSAEEIKDIICTTAFWMIVREGFGGVGKEKRKGDGWRIRA